MRPSDFVMRSIFWRIKSSWGNRFLKPAARSLAFMRADWASAKRPASREFNPIHDQLSASLIRILGVLGKSEAWQRDHPGSVSRPRL
jgi:hypothetical protein